MDPVLKSAKQNPSCAWVLWIFQWIVLNLYEKRLDDPIYTKFLITLENRIGTKTAWLAKQLQWSSWLRQSVKLAHFLWFGDLSGFFFKGLLVEVIIGAQIRKQTATNRNTIKLNPKSKTAVTGTVQSLDSVDNWDHHQWQNYSFNKTTLKFFIWLKIFIDKRAHFKTKRKQL